MVPFTIRSIQMTKYRLVDCVRSNNLMLVIVGCVTHIGVNSIVVILLITTKSQYDLSALYSFVPLLVLSIFLGNLTIYFRFSDLQVPKFLLFIVYIILLLTAASISQLSIAAYLITTLLSIAGVFFSYRMLNAYD